MEVHHFINNKVKEIKVVDFSRTFISFLERMGVMSELEMIIQKYLSKTTTVDIYSNISETEINKLFYNMKQYERPDILSIYDNKIVAIEHFEFDSYKNLRKGSNLKIQENFIENEMKNKINLELKTKDEVVVHDEIKNTTNLQQYYDNFKKVFLSHVDNIPEYREHIEQDFGNEKDIEFWFFAEDVTSLGTHQLKNGNLGPLLPLSNEILDILKKHKEIKGIIFGIFAMHEHKMLIMYNDTETLNKLKESEQFKVTDKEFTTFNTKIVGFAIKIPKEEMEAETN